MSGHYPSGERLDELYGIVSSNVVKKKYHSAGSTTAISEWKMDPNKRHWVQMIWAYPQVPKKYPENTLHSVPGYDGYSGTLVGHCLGKPNSEEQENYPYLAARKLLRNGVEEGVRVTEADAESFIYSIRSDYYIESDMEILKRAKAKMQDDTEWEKLLSEVVFHPRKRPLGVLGKTLENIAYWIQQAMDGNVRDALWEYVNADAPEDVSQQETRFQYIVKMIYEMDLIESNEEL